VITKPIKEIEFLAQREVNKQFQKSSDEIIEEKILKQVNYYFSEKNLEKDVHMNKVMEEDPEKGFPILSLLEFNRIR
jgi:hypothetical protein